MGRKGDQKKKRRPDSLRGRNEKAGPQQKKGGGGKREGGLCNFTRRGGVEVWGMNTKGDGNRRFFQKVKRMNMGKTELLQGGKKKKKGSGGSDWWKCCLFFWGGGRGCRIAGGKKFPKKHGVKGGKG